MIDRRVSAQDPDTALFSDMEREIGGFYLSSRSTEYPCLPDPRQIAEDNAASIDIERTGVENTLDLAVLRQLAVPAAVLEAVVHTRWATFRCRQNRSATPCCWPITWPRWHRRCCRPKSARCPRCCTDRRIWRRRWPDEPLRSVVRMVQRPDH